MKAADAIRRALTILEEDGEAANLCRPAILESLVLENLTMRAGNDEPHPVAETIIPAIAFQALGAIEALDYEPVPPWRKWGMDDRYKWLSGAVVESDFLRVMAHCADGLTEAAKQKPRVAQPGREDGGLLPFLVRELSGVMRKLYGQPLDDTVALIVTAVADLPEPLSRDGVRPYLKGR